MARVPYLDREQLAPNDRSLLDRPINLFRAMVNSPKCLRAMESLGAYIRYGSALDGRLREMAILQVAYLTRSEYEWSHHIKIGRDFGVSDEDMHAIVADTEGRTTHLDPITKLILLVAREMTLKSAITDKTFAALTAHLNNELLVDLVAMIGYYNSVSRVLAALQIDVEEDYRRYLEEFPLPKSDGA